MGRKRYGAFVHLLRHVAHRDEVAQGRFPVSFVRYSTDKSLARLSAKRTGTTIDNAARATARETF